MKSILKQLSGKIQEINEVRKEYNKRKKKTPKIKAPRVTASKSQKVELEIKAFTVIKILLIIWLFWLLQNILLELKSIVIISAISFFMAMGLSPIVSKFENYHIPRPLAILIIYVLFFGVLGLIFVKIIPILAEQLIDIAYDLRQFIANNNGVEAKFPIIQKLSETLQFNPVEVQQFISQNLTSISTNLQSIAGSTFGILSQVFSGVFNFIFALVLTFFILLEREAIAHFILHLFPARQREYIQTRFGSVQHKLSEWVRGQFVLMISMGSFIYVGMKILEYTMDMKYAATLGLLAGIMELFPFIGVLITGILGVLIAANISWPLVIAVIALIALSQFLEGNVLVPMVMEKVVGLSAVVTILAVATGGILGASLGGAPLAILGMIFSVPIAASIGIFVEEYAHRSE